VLRSNPPDFFKPYAENLKALNGKWNGMLKAPDGFTIMGGWIFSNKGAEGVRQFAEAAVVGQVQPIAHQTPTQQYQRPMAVVPGGGPTVPIGYAPSQPILTPTTQSMQIFKPFIGQPIKLQMGGNIFAAQVLNVTTDQFGLVSEAQIRLADGQVTMIKVTPPRWTIPGLEQPHDITI
jgi:hypothetical protein